MKKVLLIGALLLSSFAQAESVTNHPPLNQVAAYVNDDVITTGELNQRVTQLKLQLTAQKQTLPPDNIIANNVLQNLINIQLQLQLAHKLGIEVSDAEVLENVDKIAERNHLSREQLKAQLQKQGMSFDEYTDNIKKEMTMHQLQRDSVSRGLNITEKQIDRYIEHHPELIARDQRYLISDILIEGTSAEQEAKANAVVKQLREKNSLATLTKTQKELVVQNLGWRKLSDIPSLFVSTVTTLKKGDISPVIKAPNGFHVLVLDDVQGQDQHTLITQTHVRHILVKRDKFKSDAQLKHDADDLYQQLQQGAKFDELANHYSEDLNSASKGGDLGWVNAEDLVPQFVSAMNKLKPNEISKPVSSPFGYHIIEVLDRRQIDDSVAKMRQQAQYILYQQRFSAQLQNWLLQLREQAYIKIVQA